VDAHRRQIGAALDDVRGARAPLVARPAALDERLRRQLAIDEPA
jgi:hypothetical protein